MIHQKREKISIFSTFFLRTFLVWTYIFLERIWIQQKIPRFWHPYWFFLYKFFFFHFSSFGELWSLTNKKKNAFHKHDLELNFATINASTLSSCSKHQNPGVYPVLKALYCTYCMYVAASSNKCAVKSTQIIQILDFPLPAPPKILLNLYSPIWIPYIVDFSCNTLLYSGGGGRGLAYLYKFVAVSRNWEAYILLSSYLKVPILNTPPPPPPRGGGRGGFVRVDQY